MEDLAASADGMVISLRRADADLSAVMHRLENEFQQRFEGREGNPLKIMQRLRTLQGELPDVIENCQRHLKEKQELWKAIQVQMAANEQLLQRLSAKAGLPSGSHASAMEGIERMQLMLDSAIRSTAEV